MSLVSKKKKRKKRLRKVRAVLTLKKVGLAFKKHEVGITGNPLDREAGVEYKVTF